MNNKKILSKQKRHNNKVVNAGKRVFFDIVYFTLVIPFAIGLRLFSDPLKMKAKSKKHLWLDRAMSDIKIEQARRQI